MIRVFLYDYLIAPAPFTEKSSFPSINYINLLKNFFKIVKSYTLGSKESIVQQQDGQDQNSSVLDNVVDFRQRSTSCLATEPTNFS